MQRDPAKCKAKNSTKKEEKEEKTKLKFTEIQRFYELTKKDTDEEAESDVDSITTKPNTETLLLQDTEAKRLQEKLITLCNMLDVTKRRLLEMESAMMAISYIKISTRIPVSACNAIDQALQVVINSLTEIALRVTHAEEKTESPVTATIAPQPAEEEATSLPT